MPHWYSLESGLRLTAMVLTKVNLSQHPFFVKVRVKMAFSWGCSGCIDNTAVIWSKAERKVDT